jgi:hypothetical protein
MNLQESIRRILREEVNSVDVRTIESELTNMLGPSKIKNGNRVEFVRIGSFNSSFDIVVDRLDQKTLNYILASYHLLCSLFCYLIWLIFLLILESAQLINTCLRLHMEI